jgi:hypothetical protein
MPKKWPNLKENAISQPAQVPSAEPLPLQPLAIFAGLVFVQLCLYYFDSPSMHLSQRWAALAFLSSPDMLFTMWCGGKIANFSLLDRWPIVLLALTVLGGAWLAGNLFLSLLRVKSLLTQLERHVFSLAVGLNLLSLYALAIGLAGGLQQRWLFVVPLVLLAVANLFLWRRGDTPPTSASFIARDEAFPGADDPKWLWWLLAAAPFAFALLFGSMLPPWDYDVREYHLQTPKEWFQNGRVGFLPHNIYANMPLGSELLSVWGMVLVGGTDGWWWGAIAGKTIMACYALIAAAGLIAFGQRLHSLAAGVIAAIAFLSAPWIVSLGSNGLNEGPVAMYAILAVFAMWLAASSSSPAGSKPAPGGSPIALPVSNRLVLLSGFLAGSSVACKYPPMLFVVIPLAAWIILGDWLTGLWQQQRTTQTEWAQSRLRAKGAFRPSTASCTLLIVFLAAAFAACGLWFAKNAVQTNNPTYPLLYSAFDGETRTPEKDAQWKKVHSPQPDKAGNRFPLSGFFREIPWNGWRTLWASLLIPPLALASLFATKQRPTLATIALWAAFVFVAWWLFTHRLDRFLVLLLPAGALAAGVGAFAVPHPLWRVATLGFVLTGATVQFVFVTIHPDNRYFAPLDRLRRDDRDLGEIGLRVEAAHRWLNENGKAGEKVLLLGDAEPFDLEIPAVYNTCFDDCQFSRIFKDRSREERLAALHDGKIAYVFCSWNHLARYRSPGNYGYTSDFPTRELVHNELIGQQKLLIPIPLESEEQLGELFRVAVE